MWRRTADSCRDGPRPKMATDDERGSTAFQGYDPVGGAQTLDTAMGAQPKGEQRIERSVRTSGWLARIATSTAAGKLRADATPLNVWLASRREVPGAV